MKKRNSIMLISSAAVCAALLIAIISGCIKKESNYIKVGILHSVSGPMAISEGPVRDAELLAIKEINEAGGILGKQIKVIIEDGESNPVKFAEKAEKLLKSDKVATVFGCWTSASRKAVKKIFEENYGLLWYPIQYEGLEASPNIVYIGAAPNQQVVPAINYCSQKFGKRMYLIGSDYVYPHTANNIIKAQLKSISGICAGEKYFQMEETDFNYVIDDIIAKKPDVIINTLNGQSNIYFFKQLKDKGITSEKIPVMSFSISEGEIAHIGVENIKGHLLAWNYFGTTGTVENRKFVDAYKKEYGDARKFGDPVEAGYIAVHLWAKSCEKAKSFDVEPVRIAAKGMKYKAPEGPVTIDGLNQHLYKTVRIGKIQVDGSIIEVWSTKEQIKPDPYLSTYAWARGI